MNTERSLPCLISDLDMILAIGLSYLAFIILNHDLLVPSLQNFPLIRQKVKSHYQAYSVKITLL